MGKAELIELNVSLSHTQFEAANRLYDELPRWELTDRSLELLAERFPGFGPEATLLKVVALNSLYGTNVYATVRMAEHIEGVMNTVDIETAGLDLVERIADLPPWLPGQKHLHHRSFASKFAHFFIDSDRFPIMDSYAVRMVRYHLGARNCTPACNHPYAAFVTDLTRLAEAVGMSRSDRVLDRYLWLAGQYLTWRQKPSYPINAELAALFANECAKVQGDLAALVGASPDGR